MKKLLLFLSVVSIFAACNSGSEKSTSQEPESDTARLITVVLKVGGMHCTGCEQTICKAVEGLNGVNKVTASYLDSVASVTYDSTLVNSGEISNKIDEVGYTVLAEK